MQRSADFRWPRMARNVRALECDSVWFQFLLSLARRKCGGRGENKRTTARKNTIRMRYPFWTVNAFANAPEADRINCESRP